MLVVSLDTADSEVSALIRCTRVSVFCVACLPSFIGVYGDEVTSSDQAEEGLVLSQIREAWTRRQDRCRDAVIAYSLTVQDRSGVPERTYSTHGRVSLAGQKMRFELSGTRPGGDPDVMVDQPYTSAFDGELSKTLFDPNAETKYPVGYIHADARSPDISTWETLPARWAFTPALPELCQISVDELQFG